MQCRKVDDSFRIYVVFSSSVLYVTRTNGLVNDKSLLLFGRNIRKSFYPQSCNSKDAYTVKIIMGLTSITYCMARKTNIACPLLIVLSSSQSQSMNRNITHRRSLIFIRNHRHCSRSCSSSSSSTSCMHSSTSSASPILSASTLPRAL